MEYSEMESKEEAQQLLWTAIKRNNSQLIARAVNQKADVNKEDIEGRSPLHFAVRKNRLEAIKALIKFGAHVDSKNKQWDNGTPLHVAAWAGNIEVAKLLIEAGADIRKRDGNQFVPIHRASWNGQEEMVKLFLDLGVEVDIEGGGYLTPLHKAAECNKPKIVSLLLANRADPKKLDCCEQTAHMMASRRKHKDVMKILEERCLL